jgi:hypothetical protein
MKTSMLSSSPMITPNKKENVFTLPDDSTKNLISSRMTTVVLSSSHIITPKSKENVITKPS